MPVVIPQQIIHAGPEPEPAWEQLILQDWNNIAWPSFYFKNEEALALVDAFKERLQKNYGMRYLASGGSSNVYVHRNEKFVVKICQVMAAEPADFGNYLTYQKSSDILSPNLDYADAMNWREVQRVKRGSVLYPHIFSDNMLMCIQRYIKQDDFSNAKTMAYFDSILGNYQVQAFRRVINWRDIGPINNIAWSNEDKKPYIIDL
jgi:hypothetical protein